MTDLGVVALALKVAEAVGLTGWIAEKFDGAPSVKTAKIIVDTAVKIAGAGTVEEALDVLSRDAAKAAEANAAILEAEFRAAELDAVDRTNARAMYQATDHTLTNYVAKRIIDENMKLVGLFVLLQVLAFYTVSDPTALLAIGNVIGAVCTALLSERQTIITFLFGSSFSSRVTTLKNAVADFSAKLRKG